LSQQGSVPALAAENIVRPPIGEIDPWQWLPRVCARTRNKLAATGLGRATTLGFMATDKMQRGAAAEALAAEYLTDHGLTLIARNLRCKCGELDLVCLDGEVLVIVEVRHRATGDFGGALASVNGRKQRKLLRAARYQWQRRADWRERRMRFDVVAVGSAPHGAPEGVPVGAPPIEWVRDAFRAGS